MRAAIAVLAITNLVTFAIAVSALHRSHTHVGPRGERGAQGVRGERGLRGPEGSPGLPGFVLPPAPDTALKKKIADVSARVDLICSHPIVDGYLPSADSSQLMLDRFFC